MVRSRSAAAPTGGEMDQLSLEDLDEIDLLLTELKISEGRGNLILCTVASPAYREKIIRAIKRQLSARVIQVDDGDRLISDLRMMRAKEEKDFTGGIIWVLPETLTSDILDAINNFRELFYEVGLPSLIFLTPAALDDVIWKAPDLWRYRGGFHRLKGEEGGLSFQAVEALSIPLGFSYQSKEELLRRKRINEHLLEKMKDKQAQGNALSELGLIHLLLGEYQKANQYFEQHLAIAREIGDCTGEAEAWHELATIDLYQGNYEPARAKLQKSLEMRQQIGDRAGEAATWHQLASIDLRQGEYGPARTKFQKSLEIFQQIGDRAGEAATWHALASIDLDQGEYGQARTKFQKSLEMRQQIGDRAGEAATFAQLGIMAAQLGRAEECLRLVALGAIILQQIGHADQKKVAPWVNELASKLGYTEVQLDAIWREVAEEYRKDRGRGILAAAFEE